MCLATVKFCDPTPIFGSGEDTTSNLVHRLIIATDDKLPQRLCDRR